MCVCMCMCAHIHTNINSHTYTDMRKKEESMENQIDTFHQRNIVFLLYQRDII